MKIAFVGDTHIAEKKGINPITYEKRKHIIEHDHEDLELIEHLNNNKVDQVVFLGDLIDWYSPKNIEKCLHLLKKLNMPWHLTPGNHDYQLDLILRPHFNDGKVHPTADITPLICKKVATKEWNRQGVETRSRKIKLNSLALYLIDSAVGSISQEDQSWLINDLQIEPSSFKIIATHIPFPFVDLDKNFTKFNKVNNDYLQQNLINEFEEILLKYVNIVYCGHVHFNETSRKNNTEFHMITLSTRLEKENAFEGVTFFEL